MTNILPIQITAALLICVIAGCSSTELTDSKSSNQTLIEAEIEVDSSSEHYLNVLNERNIYDAVKGVLTLLNEEPMRSPGVRFANAISEIDYKIKSELNNPYQLIFTSGSNSLFNSRRVYDCPGGGSSYLYKYSSQRGTEDKVFNSCKIGEYTFNGTAGARAGYINGVIGNYPKLNFTTVHTTGETLSISGNYYIGSSSRVVLQLSSGWENMQLNRTSVDGVLRVSNFNIARNAYHVEGRTIGVSIEANFTASGEWSNSKNVDVTATLSYEGNEDSFEWQVGSIRIFAHDGSNVVVTPGDPSTSSWQLLLNEQVVDILPASGEYWVDCGVSSLCPGE